MDFVKKTGFYNEVFAYDEVADNLPNTASILVDFEMMDSIQLNQKVTLDLEHG